MGACVVLSRMHACQTKSTRNSSTVRDLRLIQRCSRKQRGANGVNGSEIIVDCARLVQFATVIVKLKLDAAVNLDHHTYSSQRPDMPLQHSPDPTEPSWAQDVKTEYLIFFSSRDEGGKLWCPVRGRSPSA